MSSEIPEKIVFTFKRHCNLAGKFTKQNLERIEFLVRQFCQNEGIVADFEWFYNEEV